MYVSAREAAHLLDVKRETLYAYAARGLLKSRPGPGTERRYARAEVMRLKTRADARRGHRAVAAGALDFGHPSVDTAISDIDDEGPRYRGVSVRALLGGSFEEVCRLLWDRPDHVFAPGAARFPSGPPLAAVIEVCANSTPDAILRTVCGAPDGALARGLARALTERTRVSRAVVRVVEDALILSADHGMNASTFSARVVASTGARLDRALVAAACALSGPRHGGACARVEALLAEARLLKQPGRVVDSRLSRGDLLPGLTHPLYPRGDPRGRLLMARAPSAKIAHAVARRAARLKLGFPTLDFGLVALAEHLKLSDGSAARMFAAGRLAGWVAHAEEAAARGELIRPRARYRRA